MHLEDTAGVGLTVLGEVGPTDPAEVATHQAEAATYQAMEGEEYPWVRWQPAQAQA